MATPDKGLIKRSDAGRIARAVMKVENMTQPKGRGTSASTRHTFAFAKVTKILPQNEGPAFYEAEEVLINNSQDLWEPVTNGRLWTSDSSTLEPIFSISAEDRVDEGRVYLVMRTNIEGTGGKGKWCIVSETEVKVTDSITNEQEDGISFQNDIDFPFNEKEVDTPAQNELGSAQWGNAVYGGQEEPAEDKNSSSAESTLVKGVERHYKFFSNHDTPKMTILIPQTDALIVDDDTSVGELNKLWIGIWPNRFSGQSAEVHHQVLAESLYSSGTSDYRHEYVNADTDRGIFYVYSDSAGTTLVPVIVDRCGHIVKIDTTATTIDEYPKDANITLTVGTVPSAGASDTLYDVAITQTTDLDDDAGVDTNTFNGALNLKYTAVSSNGTKIDIGFTQSTNPNGELGDSTEYNGAGTGGNDDDVRYDLSKILDGSKVTLTVELTSLNRTASASFDLDSVWIQCEIQTTPVPDNTSFDVWAWLLTKEVGGARYSRFDGTAEYALDIYIYFEADEQGFDTGDPDTYIQMNSVNVDEFDTASKSGGSVSFTEDFESWAAGSGICARAYLRFQTAAKVLDRQKGLCTTLNGGNFGKHCDVITGTAFTGALTTDATDYSAEAEGDNISVEGVEMRCLKYPIEVDFVVSPNTTAFSSDATKTSALALTSGGKTVRWSGTGLSISNDTLYSFVNTASADGWSTTIQYLEEAEIFDGAQYVLTETTSGISDSPNSAVFYINTNTPAPLPGGLSHHYKFNNNYDDSVGTDDLTDNNSMGFTNDATFSNYIETIGGSARARNLSVDYIDQDYSWMIFLKPRNIISGLYGFSKTDYAYEDTFNDYRIFNVNYANAANLSAGQWYCFAHTYAYNGGVGSQSKYYHAAITDSAMTHFGTRSAVLNFNDAEIANGGTNTFDGGYKHYVIWGGKTLTDAEVDQAFSNLKVDNS
jgi:hypothetical protein